MTNNGKKKLTVMFFLASDNALSPSLLTQLLAIKSAGFQVNTNVLVHFDPNEQGVPTRYFDVNRNERDEQTSSRIGDSFDPVLSGLAGDSIEPDEMLSLPGQSSNLAARLANNDAVKADEALESFLTFCRENYPAERYVLFLVGHGLVVGSDTFLPDDNPSSAIGLTTLGGILRRFSGEIKFKGERLELIAMHSCCMSAIEVAYELRNTASYMMASQGISFVGAWPYRQLLMDMFNAIETARESDVDVLELVTRLHGICLHSSGDFIFAGYSTDLCLCSLDSTKIQQLDEPIRKLSQALTDGLQDEAIRDLILLAHWKSQSYWQETYTDLYDFCFCLSKSCVQPDEKQKALQAACKSVTDKLDPKQPNEFDGPVLQSGYFGPDAQYSHGLSIYFPWSPPIEDANKRDTEHYQDYAFSELVTPSWWDFLGSYFHKTERDSRESESKVDPGPVKRLASQVASSRVDMAGVLRGQGRIESTALNGKVSPPDSGGAFSFTTIKNYPRGFSTSVGGLKNSPPGQQTKPHGARRAVGGQVPIAGPVCNCRPLRCVED